LQNNKRHYKLIKRKKEKMAKNITIYTTNSCAYCGMVKKWLNIKGYSYDEVNIEEHPERAKEAQAASGQLTVPITIVTKADDSQVVVVGYNLSRLAPAVA
jgi:glutaredoxin 3